MIATEYTERAAAITYPDLRDITDWAERDRLRQEYGHAQVALNQEFAQSLAEEYLGGIPESRRAGIAQDTFSLAWEYGVASGYSEIESYYSDFACFARQVYMAATA